MNRLIAAVDALLDRSSTTNALHDELAELRAARAETQTPDSGAGRPAADPLAGGGGVGPQ